jgi:hypothetical protein
MATRIEQYPVFYGRDTQDLQQRVFYVHRRVRTNVNWHVHYDATGLTMKTT